jgi:fumarylacetoacetase
MSDPTLDPALVSWVPVADGSDFPIQNLPFGVVDDPAGPRVVVAIGDAMVDLASAHAEGAFDGLGMPPDVFHQPSLNAFMALGPPTWRSVRAAVSGLLGRDQSDRETVERWLRPQAGAELLVPVDVRDYIDFYSSIHHATNLGRMFRPDSEPLLPNWRHLPIGYHGRASTVVVSGTPVVRPMGQRRGTDGPSFGPSERLDIELEVGFVTGVGSELGSPIPVALAEEHIFGVCLVNDWSARDIQAWEYQPLGPFLGKSFATSISPWIVTLDALRPFRAEPPPQEPEPLAYLRTEGPTALAIDLEVELNGSVISRVGFDDMYWTMAQQLAHASVNGTRIGVGDLYASGTVSGTTPDALGSLIELTLNGSRPIDLGDGSRTFLEDGDTVVLRGRCRRAGAASIGFGECAGTILPAVTTERGEA